MYIIIITTIIIVVVVEKGLSTLLWLVSLHCSGCPRTHYVDQVDLEVTVFCLPSTSLAQLKSLCVCAHSCVCVPAAVPTETSREHQIP